MKCDDNCFECVDTATKCTKCKAPLYLDTKKNTCVSDCKIDSGTFKNDIPGNPTCSPCDPSCL